MTTESVTSDGGMSLIRVVLCNKFDKRYKWAIRQEAVSLEGIKEYAFK